MKVALLLVDIQNDFLDSSDLQPPRHQLISLAAALLQTCRQRRIPVIHIWTTVSRDSDHRLPHWKKADRWICLAGTEGHKTPARLLPLESDFVIHKHGFNPFANGQLDSVLKKIGCDTVVISGIHLHACVRTAAVESLERGFQVFVADDAVASNDHVHSVATRRWLSQRCVEFLPSSDILSRLNGQAPANLVHRAPRETEEILFEIPVAGANEIASATLCAQAAWKSWRKTSIGSRCNILEQLATRLESAAPDLARQMAVEIGKPISHGLEEVRRAAANVRDVVRRAATFAFHVPEPAGLVRHEPHGIVALVSPWNNPVAIPVGKIAPALVYGNTVVWKPAPAATQISQAVLNLLWNAGVPQHAVQLLPGDHSTAQELAANQNVNAVSLTGSAQAGYAIQAICAQRFLPFQAELGGNNAAVIWDDADLAQAARQVAWGAFGFAGQRCTATRRLIVSEASFESLWAELKLAAEELNWGDPLEPSTDIGPVIDAGKRAALTALISTARASGAKERVELLFENRAKESWVKAGAYAQPAIICCNEPHHPLVQEETMSPLLVVQRAQDFDHAVRLCNGVRHGLAAALFSNSIELQNQFLGEAKAGILKINSTTAGVDVSLPFGGWKMSGLGPPEHGTGDRLFYTRMQAVYGAERPAPG
jgi:alpha-ketoglutaric semialdehyde dehydrogenase